LVQNPNTGKFVGIDYYQKAKRMFTGKFRKVLQVEIILPSEEEICVFPTQYYTRNKDILRSKEFSLFDITNESDNVINLIDKLDEFELLDIHDKDKVTYWSSVDGIHLKMIEVF
jgi:hypothetical protein